MSGFLKLKFDECEALSPGQMKMLVAIMEQSGTMELSRNMEDEIEIDFYKKEASNDQ